jgi:hypothetical protein
MPALQTRVLIRPWRWRGGSQLMDLAGLRQVARQRVGLVALGA